MDASTFYVVSLVLSGLTLVVKLIELTVDRKKR